MNCFQCQESSKTKGVAICSRDSEENYRWLRDLVGTKVKACHPLCISNDVADFKQEVRGYKVAILYHTKNRGRINITNVTDSLYDEELKFLHDRLGRSKVIVVIDDLEKSDEEEKRRIMEAQKDLGTFAEDVFLFTREDKRVINGWKSSNSEVDRKLKALKQIVKKGKD